MIFSVSLEIYSGGHFGGFGGFGGGGRQRGKGSNLRVRIKLNLTGNGKCVQQNHQGKENEISTRVTTKPVQHVKGSGVQMKIMNTMFGQMQTQTTCGTCNGLGKVADKNSFRS